MTHTPIKQWGKCVWNFIHNYIKMCMPDKFLVEKRMGKVVQKECNQKESS